MLHHQQEMRLPQIAPGLRARNDTSTSHELSAKDEEDETRLVVDKNVEDDATEVKAVSDETPKEEHPVETVNAQEDGVKELQKPSTKVKTFFKMLVFTVMLTLTVAFLIVVVAPRTPYGNAVQRHTKIAYSSVQTAWTVATEKLAELTRTAAQKEALQKKQEKEEKEKANLGLQKAFCWGVSLPLAAAYPPLGYPAVGVCAKFAYSH